MMSHFLKTITNFGSPKLPHSPAFGYHTYAICGRTIHRNVNARTKSVKAVNSFLDCYLFYDAVGIIAQGEHSFSSLQIKTHKNVSEILCKTRIRAPCFRDNTTLPNGGK
jgi:hypothetical protein